MRTWRFSGLLMSLLVLGVVVEINAAYRKAVGIPVEAMGNVPVQRIPAAFRDTITELPLVREYDSMTLTSGTVMVFSD